MGTDTSGERIGRNEHTSARARDGFGLLCCIYESRKEGDLLWLTW
jgi:hypothetical protein